ncbi:MAG: hypothetical protein ACYC4K_01320 [Thiobacillus sp.]
MNNQKIISASLLFGLWAALVFVGIAPVSDLIEAIKLTLAGLGVYHGITTLQEVQK